MAKKFNRKNVFFISIAVMVLALILFLFAGNSLPLVLTAAVLFYIPQPLIFLVVLMIITDSVEYGQLKFGHRDESLTLSVRPLLDKMGGAISNGVVGLTAVWAGMTAGASSGDITTHGHMVFKLMMFGVPVALILIGTFIFFRKVTLDEKQHAQIVEELEKTWGQTLGEDVDFIDADGSVSYDYAVPVDGEVVPLETVADDNFASGKMGEGFAIKPTDGKVYAPFDGTVKVTFPTRHAVGLVSNQGVGTLIHIGIGTVNMRGTGFVEYAEKEQHVKKGDLLIEFWSPAIEKAGYDDTVMVVMTDHVSQTHMLKDSGAVVHGDSIMTFKQ